MDCLVCMFKSTFLEQVWFLRDLGLVLSETSLVLEGHYSEGVVLLFHCRDQELLEVSAGGALGRVGSVQCHSPSCHASPPAGLSTRALGPAGDFTAPEPVKPRCAAPRARRWRTSLRVPNCSTSIWSMPPPCACAGGDSSGRVPPGSAMGFHLGLDWGLAAPVAAGPGSVVEGISDCGITEEHRASWMPLIWAALPPNTLCLCYLTAPFSVHARVP